MAVLHVIDRLPWLWVTVIAAWLAAAPIVPEPHLIEKLRMLSQGTLNKAIDIFDLLLHATPLLLWAVKGLRWLHLRRNNGANI